MTTIDTAITGHGSRWATPRRLADLPRWRLVVARVFGVNAIAFGPVYLSWRLGSTAGPSSFALTFWVAELVAYASIVFSVVLLWNRRVRDDPLGIPRGTLDIFVPVCGEPTEMVAETLAAAVAVSYPHETWLLNDGRLAGKDNWRAIEQLARRQGVRCLTRTEGGRGKAANLNHGLRRSSGDFVGVIDADHRADSDFADELLGYFDDPGVAFVATPQLFELPGEDVLNNLEPSSTAAYSRPRTQRMLPSPVGTAWSTGAARSPRSPGSPSGTSSKTCTRPTGCMPPASRASTTRGQ